MPDKVVLVHGLWFGAWSLKVLDARLRRRGFEVFRFHYSTTRTPLADCAEQLHGYCRAVPGGSLHLAGHSMGGLLILHMLKATGWDRPGRLLFLGTPLGGSAVARRVASWPGGSVLLGHAAETLLRSDVPFAADRETGMIAGTLPVGLGLLAGGLPPPHDGTVAVAETRHPNVSERCELRVSHTGMLFSRAVVRQCTAFLLNGRFLAPSEGRGSRGGA